MKSKARQNTLLSLDADLFLIDSSSYFYRAYYALPQLTNSNGQPTGASLGYSRMLMKLIKQASIKYGACLFDSRESKRKELYPEYKANRKKMPEELVSQVSYLTDISYFLGFNAFRLDGYEADDLIAYIVENFSKKHGVKTCIVSSDKDLKQLLCETVFIYDALKNKTTSAEEFEAEFGIKPPEFVYILALMGDASDNIPGIKGIGEKTAYELVRKFKTLDGIYENIDLIKQEKIKNLLILNKENAYKSFELASFFKEIDIKGAYFIPEIENKQQSNFKNKQFKTIDDFALKEKNIDGLYNIFKDLEFNSLIKDLNIERSKENEDKEIEEADPPELFTPEEENILSIYIDFNNGDKNISPDLLNFSNDDNLPIVSVYSKTIGGIELNAKDILNNISLSNLLKDHSVKKIGIEIYRIEKFLNSYAGATMRGDFFDLSIASYLINPIRHKHTFEALKNEFEDNINSIKKKFVHLTDLNVAGQALNIFALYKILSAEIEKDEALNYLFHNVDMPLSEILNDMERTGFKVDKYRLMSLSAELDFEAKKLGKIICEIAGKEFNINSPKQLSKIMFEEMGFRRVKKDSTDIDVLSTLKTELEFLLKPTEDANATEKFPKNYLSFVDSLISYRSKVKLKTSFTDVLLREIDENDRVHTSFSQITTSTGRLASQKPNLQNIPIAGSEGTKIRQSFIAKDGCVLLSADYSQIDLRVMASISGDTALITSFRNNEDIHARTASEVFGVEIDGIDAAMRRKAKVINFGIIYGMSPYGLSKELGISSEEAKSYIDKFFQNHPLIRAYMNKTVFEAKKAGFVRTAFGRRCYVEGINSKIRNLSSFAERAAINAPIQGTAADIIKIAMVNIYKTLKNETKTDAYIEKVMGKNPLPTSAKMILQVHDELIFEVKTDFADKLKEIVAIHMSDKTLLKDVPLSVNIGIGKNWSEAH